MPKINLLIVDDHPMIREGLVTMLAHFSDIQIIGTCADGQEAIEAVKENLPDVILMDLKMVKMNGIETTREIVSRYPGVRVIILTIYEDADSVRLALQAGASGYVLKQASREKLVESIRLVHRGNPIIDTTLLSQLVIDYTRMAKEAATHGQTQVADDNKRLSTRENEIARLLAQGLTNKEISAKTHLAVDTVKTHLRNIYRKLGAKNRSQAITLISRKISL